MAKAATVTINLAVSGDGLSEQATIPVASNLATQAQKITAPLVNGRNNVFPGKPFQIVVLVPLANSTIAKTWDAANTVGGPLSPNVASLIACPANTTSVNVNCTGIGNGLTDDVEMYFV